MGDLQVGENQGCETQQRLVECRTREMKPDNLVGERVYDCTSGVASLVRAFIAQDALKVDAVHAIWETDILLVHCCNHAIYTDAVFVNAPYFAPYDHGSRRGWVPYSRHRATANDPNGEGRAWVRTACRSVDGVLIFKSGETPEDADPIYYSVGI